MEPLRGLMGIGFFLLMSLVVLVPVFGFRMFWPVLGAFFTLLFLGLGLMIQVIVRDTPEDVKRLWKWGLLYMNPDDSRLWVEKRFGFGWTLNFARPMARVVMGLLVLLALIPLAILLFTAR